MDASSASESATGTMRMNLPMMPGISISGKKAAMVVAVAESTGDITSSVPSTAARAQLLPSCRCR
jgi:hypothetical protein